MAGTALAQAAPLSVPGPLCDDVLVLLRAQRRQLSSRSRTLSGEHGLPGPASPQGVCSILWARTNLSKSCLCTETLFLALVSSFTHAFGSR